MKKILSLLTLIPLLSYAYNSVDVSNANYLANENIIVKQSTTAKYRLDDRITRAEAIGTALKLK